MILSEKACSKYSKWFTAIAAVLIVLGTYNRIFALVALCICAVSFVILDKEHSVCMLMFLLPLSNIFKLSPSSQSFFTYITLFYVLYTAINKRRVNKKFLSLLMALTVLIMLQAYSSFHLLRFIKFIANILLIYIAMKLEPEKSHKGVFLSFVLGVVVSSLIALSGAIPNLVDYIGVKDLGLANDWLVRFSGMYGDPNYYSINVIVSLCLLVLMWHRREITPLLAIALAVLLVYFIVITYSRSAFLMLALPILLFIYSNMKNKKYFFAVVLGIGVIYLAVLALAGEIDALDMVLSRFDEKSGDVTSGRTILWGNYLSLFAEKPFVFLIGRGLGAGLLGGTAPHNTYIDFLYYLGLVGTVIFLLTIAAIPKPEKEGKNRNVFNYSVFICIGIMYFFISEIFYIDLPFHIILAFLACNLSLDKYEKR